MTDSSVSHLLSSLERYGCSDFLSFFCLSGYPYRMFLSYARVLTIFTKRKMGLKLGISNMFEVVLVCKYSISLRMVTDSRDSVFEHSVRVRLEREKFLRDLKIYQIREIVEATGLKEDVIESFVSAPCDDCTLVWFFFVP